MGKILKDIKRKQEQLKQMYNNACFEALSNEFPNYLDRIFKKGGATKGEIGKYSTKAMYVGSSNFRNKKMANSVLGSKKKRAGLNWITTKNGNHLAEISEGYKAFRALNGLQNSKVDLNFNGDLFRSVVIVNNGDGTASIRINNPQQYKIARGNEEHFKKSIFHPTNKEIQNMYNYIEKYFTGK